MKKIIAVFVFMLPFLSMAQNVSLPIDSITHKIAFTVIGKIDSVSADRLYSRALLAIAKIYNTPNTIIEVSDRAAGVIIIKAMFISYKQDVFGKNFPNGNKVTYTSKVIIKDGKYKLTISDFIIELPNNIYELPSKGKPHRAKRPIKYWNRTREKAKLTAETILEKFQEEMSLNSKSSDW